MRVTKSASLLALAALGVAFVSATGAEAACKTYRGKGWGFTEEQAKFQAWEIITQVTGNWPFATDTLKNDRYKCKPDAGGVTCFCSMDVCKP